MSEIYPPKAGLNHRWQVGEIAIRACMGGPRHSLIIETNYDHAVEFYRTHLTCLDCSGIVNGHHVQDLLTVEGYLRHCDRMRDDWTGREYRERVELARTGLPFTPPEWWAKAVETAMQPLAPLPAQPANNPEPSTLNPQHS